MKIAIVTDSASDISSELAIQHDIHIVPALLIMNGHSLEDGRGISRQELYQQLPSLKIPPTTSAPSAGTFQDMYEKLLHKGADQVISIHVSSILSGIFNAASIAAKAFGQRVNVIDSCHVTLGQGYQVLAAAKAAREGSGVAEIAKIIS